MKKILALTLVLVLIFSFSGCTKELSAEQKIANLERSNRELAEAANRSQENYERIKQQNQEYLDAYAKASRAK